MSEIQVCEEYIKALEKEKHHLSLVLGKY